MGYKHDRSSILEAALRLATRDGLSQLTFGRLARDLGIADRTVVYYFPTKDDLVGAVALALAERLQGLLEEAFGPDPLPAADLMRRAWPVLTTPDADEAFGVFFKLVGLAAAGVAPFTALGRLLVDGWVDWLAPKVDERTGPKRRAAAVTAVAALDGALLVRNLMGPAAGDLAATGLGLR